MTQITIAYTTLGSLKEAEALAEKAVSENHALCVNIIPGVLSVYAWEGRIEKSPECVMIFKTALSKAKELEVWLLSQHPYTVPAFLKGSVETSDAFFSYVEEGAKKT